MIKKVTDSIIYAGANDHEIDLFEGQYPVPDGIAYNSYVILDDKTAVMDTIDKRKTDEWLANVEKALDGRKPDYLVIQHMEPDHSASIQAFMDRHPETTVVGNKKTFNMIHQFFPYMELKNTLTVENGDVLELGSHKLTFVFAPMVHWPEVMMTYESEEKILFSADGFGKFGALDVDDDWACEARRYYIGIVGKYGQQVQNVLKKAAALEIEKICPLHGPVLEDNLEYYINLYDIWSGYRPETDGVCICYTSVYGNTKKAVMLLKEELEKKGVPQVVVNDLARCDMTEAVEDAFRYDKLVLATTTYNSEIFPFMKTFIDHLLERNFQNRTLAFIENGSWAPTAMKIMKKSFENSKKITVVDNNVSILSALNRETEEQIRALAAELAEGYGPVVVKEDNRVNPTALFKIGYGLYVVTARDGEKDNGQIVNTVTQVSDKPNRIAVNINKVNYTCEMINKTGRLNVCVLSEDAPFKVFEHFGFQSGRDVDKFADFSHAERASNGVLFLDRYANAYISGKVVDKVDLGTHTMFICEVTESVVLSDRETMTYSYYQKEVKPRPDTDKKGFVCTVCGYIYEGDKLPDDFICPLCKHGADDFEPIG
ncbi:MAG TPA: flavin reductase [Candidatus Copromorpha excrementigallinarum]|uniref:Flavin reductase n=1 Tax=Candidatus Allocopromorpha excrementigallinarum TaxID=2840742 RepID=A0A9D1L636_9FIRM|nr:flavin reductase [Candidatus Copromorpha excrementigallinarum]